MRRRFFGIRTALAIPFVIVIVVPRASSAALLDQMQAAIGPTTFPALGQEIARALGLDAALTYVAPVSGTPPPLAPRPRPLQS